MCTINRMIQTIASDTGENVMKVKRRIELAQIKHPAQVARMLAVYAEIETLEDTNERRRK